MQLPKSTFVTLVAVALFATPVFAKNLKAQKSETEDSSPTCSSYQLAPDGNWTPLPCQELGTNSSSQHRTPPKRHDDEAH
jgi:hypothetical protein